VSAEIELTDREQRESILARAVQPYQAGFDFCIVDCAPSLGLLTVNALATVQEVIIPLQPHFLALQGLGRLLETVQHVRQSLNPVLRVSGIVLCMYEKGTKLAQEVTDDVTRFVADADPSLPWYGARVFNTVIRRNIKLAECPSFGQTIFDYAPTSNGAEDYASLAREVIKNRAAVSPGEQSSSFVLSSETVPVSAAEELSATLPGPSVPDTASP
jgi:chromosome partitioning protein